MSYRSVPTYSREIPFSAESTNGPSISACLAKFAATTDVSQQRWHLAAINNDALTGDVACLA